MKKETNYKINDLVSNEDWLKAPQRGGTGEPCPANDVPLAQHTESNMTSAEKLTHFRQDTHEIGYEVEDVAKQCPTL